MSQLNSSSRVYLISSRNDVISFFREFFNFSKKLSVVVSLSAFAENEEKGIIILDVSILEHSPPIVFNKLVHKICPVLFVEPFGVSEKIKHFVEEKFNYVIPFPLGMSVFRDYWDKIKLQLLNYHKKLFDDIITNFTNSSSFFGFFLGDSNAIKFVRTQIERVALDDSPVLLMGETGTGKTTGAKIIHKLSRRKNRKMENLSISTVVDSLASSTFFGTEKGAYTDAISKKGFFKMADKSTLFLDEIGLASPLVQGLLLNVLNSGEIQKVGSDVIEKVDIRLITATNEDLDNLVKTNRFRADLLYRINDNIIKMPALRDRKEDIPQIVKSFIKDKNRIISQEAMEKLLEFDWPGNIRQLKKCVDRVLKFYDDEIITADEINFGLIDS